MCISAHWKRKKYTHIDFIASNGGVATFFPRMYGYQNQIYAFGLKNEKLVDSKIHL